ncbi:tRNA (guanosine(37)-N1)-methyltransferase TrmD [Candidatus Falkowbacteria bacterium RIFOXYB2_FULL_38_15]|uniref:tRNA (guanine-N(1)-)-methyltransferase n=1 Tax=Candidatus Falkowbacteria bacterium RIFOXYA2_FULL_38_12 TaxID=1797993 RepID=A0A1F5S423_9BACT|nr:MAG: tRNA (guanosine(37)-N1)-methyltransferase TrmD [Candidatus Falkowbacteria bacterium RIFOXYA2_FULL_38_12]OGF32634.1 MAG: tRNA (guanosine(37)-N1)-methyltransferase TrmD [Candidatus Falkowbacteria bacterium RIFOXYB2_FULL_38_15]OGF44558.1 MAG: tRNA (guanosine(37)-N1)-methyltransferase TrmD [Candidatus Falkowbacteria bacterium RIFOXYD2_FULL_39_16]
MLQFDIITIFPEVFSGYFNESIIGRAQKNNLIKINIHNLRDWAEDKHQKVDDSPYGGGPGMVIKIEPIAKAISSIFKLKMRNEKLKVILFSAGGKQFDNTVASRLAKKYDRLILICGHYEGVDARIKKVVKDMGIEYSEISIGQYVLTGGELPAMVLVDAVARQVQGVLGKEESLEEKRLGIGVPTYTRPDIFHFKDKKYGVPKVLLSGNHRKIEEWRKQKKEG